MIKNKNYKKLFSLIFMIIVFICFQTIVYSAFSSTMNISGIGISRVESNVRITDFRISTTNNATSSFEEFGKNHIVTEIDLLDSTSSITYYLEITNYGSTDVGIFNITGLPSGVSYSIKDYNLKDKICDDSGKCNSLITKTYELTLTSTSTYCGNIQMNFDFRIFHKVTYEGIENKGYPVEVIDGGNLIISFKEDLERVQVLSNNNELGYYKNISNGTSINFSNITSDIIVKIKPRVAKLVKGNINDIGSEVCIGNECFYVISNDGSTVTMLAKYNLYVGGEYNSSWTAYGDEATGLQDSTMIGYKTSGKPFNGITPFSSTNYWYSNGSNGLKAEYGAGYPAYIYDSNSTLYNYVENYKTYLESQGAEIEEARLIKAEELEALGCSRSSYSCESASEWVYGTTYWSGTACDVNSFWVVNSEGLFYNHYFALDFEVGVRPVIELDIDEIYIPPVTIVSGDLQTVGSEVAIGDEHFYIISNTDGEIAMLSKYNLYVGGKYENSIWTAYGEEATGIQDSTMLGYKSSGQPYNGTTAFSSTSYWSSTVSTYPAYVYDSNSTLYNYVESYRTYLESQGAEIEEARLIKYEELEALGCSMDDFSCSGAPEWVYGTSYWSGAAIDNNGVWIVSSRGGFITYNYGYVTGYGVRPVIVKVLGLEI